MNTKRSPFVALAALLLPTLIGCGSEPACGTDDAATVPEQACSASENESVELLKTCGNDPQSCAAATPVSEGCMLAHRNATPPDANQCQINPQACENTKTCAALSAEVYNADITSRDLPEGLTLTKRYVGADNIGVAITATKASTGQCYVAIKGTSSFADVAIDINSLDKADCYDENGAFFGRCGSGFNMMLNRLRHAGLVDDVRAQVESGECPGGLLVTGHSLGGAITSILGISLYQTDPQTYNPYYLSLYTFGEPRTVDSDTADIFHERLSKTRWLNWGDPVPSSPGSTLGFSHFGTPREIYDHGDGDFTFDAQHQDYTTYSLGPHKVTAHKSSKYVSRLQHCQ